MRNPYVILVGNTTLTSLQEREWSSSDALLAARANNWECDHAGYHDPDEEYGRVSLLAKDLGGKIISDHKPPGPRIYPPGCIPV